VSLTWFTLCSVNCSCSEHSGHQATISVPGTHYLAKVYPNPFSVGTRLSLVVSVHVVKVTRTE